MRKVILPLLLICVSFYINAQNIAVQWDESYGTASFDQLNSIVATSDGGFLLGGYSSGGQSSDKTQDSQGQTDYWVIKTDSQGNILWDKTFGGNSLDILTAVTSTMDEGFLLAGYSQSNISGDKSENSRGLNDFWVVKIDANGNKIWDKTYGGGFGDYVKSVVSTREGGFLVGGNSNSRISGDKTEANRGTDDYWVLLLDADGNKIWDKTFGGDQIDNLGSAGTFGEDAFLLAGTSYGDRNGDKSDNSKGWGDYWIVAIDENGNKLWDKTLGSSSDDNLKSFAPTSDGHYILAGNSDGDITGDKSVARNGSSDYWIIKIDQDGNKIWDNAFGGNASENLVSIIYTQDNSLLLGGNSTSDISGDKSEGNRGNGDYWIIKIDEAGNKLWDKTLGGNMVDSFSGSTATGLNDFVVGGYSFSDQSGDKSEDSNGNADYWIAKIADETPVVQNFTMVNTETGEDLITFSEGFEINKSDLPTTSLNIRANTTGNTSRVLLEISGALTNSRSEGVVPYALYGDTSGDYNAQEFIPGDYTLTATPFSGSSPGTPLTVQFSIVETAAQAPFVTTWKTDNPGTSADNQITIPVSSEFVYNYEVDWGDGNIDAGVTGSITHTYSAPGTYTVKIQGVFPQPYFVNEGDKEKLLSIDQWGDIQWGSMLNAFHGCSNLELNASDIPNFSKVQNTQYMFRLCGSMQGHPSMSSWDMSNVTTMDFMFREAGEFNQDISGWDVSQVYSMVGMFAEAHAFNSPLISWNVAKVENMDRMFSNALLFNQPIGNWDVGAVTNMGAMFFGAKSFNQDIGNWNVSNVQNLIFTFGEAIAFNQDLSAWDLSSAIDISFMFSIAQSFNQDISNWNTSNIRYMNSVFSNAASFNQDLSSWNVSSVESMIGIFNRSGLSQKNYDAVLNGWAQLGSLQSGVPMGAGSISYCTGADARQNLIDSYGWVITDGGEDCPGNLPFITTWKTDNPGTSAENQIIIPTYPGETYNYTVDWGDGTSDTAVSGDIIHTYDSPGTYEVKITGEFPQIYFAREGDRLKLLEIRQWGNIQWQSMEYAFRGCANMDITATDLPDLSGVTSLTSMFSECSSLIGNGSMGDWDVSNVMDFSAMFANTELFNQPIGNWNISKATSIDVMFGSAHSFNQDISLWDVSNIEGMVLTFADAVSFNQDISGWDVSNVKAMTLMFDNNTAFNQDIGQWNTTNVISFYGMFRNATAFNQNLEQWDVSAAITMEDMFRGARSFDQDLGNWDVSTVTSMDDMFLDAGLSVENYDNLLRGWNDLPSLQSGVSFHAGNSQYCSAAVARQNLINTYGWSITDGGENCPGKGAFITTWKTDNPGTSAENQIIIPTYPGETYNYTVDWGDGTSDTAVSGDIIHTYDSPGVYQVSINGDFPRIYFNNVVLGLPEPGDEQKIISVDQWGTIQWSSMLGAFAGCSNLDVLAIDTPDLSMVSDMTGMFRYCESLVGNSTFNEWDLSSVTQMGSLFEGASLFNQDIGAWNVSNVVYMSSLFSAATNFNQNISSWNTANVEYMALTFSSATSFNQDIGNWDVSKVKEMIGTFAGATSFNQDIGAWDLSGTIRTDAMFSGATSFNQDIGSWDVSNVTTFNVMFYNAVSFDQNIGNWDVSNVVDMGAMFESAGMSPENYDKLLLGWSNLPTLNSGVSFNAGNSQFCESAAARQNLINTYGWVITDGGENCQVDSAFITTWKTDNAGYSEDNQITIPTYPGETYNYTVDWGDGTSDSGVTGDITHTYATPGTYQVAITGAFPQIFFNDDNGLDDIYPDREKILSIDQWGSIQWKSMNSAFIGCYNLDMLASDVPDLSQVTSLANMFNVCPSLIGNDSFREWDVSTITNMGAMFAGTNLFNIDIGNWDVSNVREMSAMFLGALSFNQDIGSWNVGNVTGMSSMFLNARAFNQDLSGWDVGNVTHMSSMFQLATSFNQPLGSWNVRQVNDMTNMFSGVTLSLDHYDNLLNGWANLPSLQNGVAFHGGDSEYCLAVEAHQMLIGKYGWAITDAGTECQGVTLAVTGFVLIDADTDQEIMSVSEGQIVNIATLPGMNLNIRADATDDVSSVGLSLTGGIVAQRTENVAPYALFGDSGGDYAGELFPTGSYTMTATPFSGRNLEGNAGTELSVSFEFVDSTPDCITFGVTSAGIGKVTNCSQPDGFATVVVSGATGPVSYSWSHDAALNEPEAYNLSVGSYTLTYSDTFCSKEITFEIEAVLPEVSLQAFDDIAADASPIALGGGLPEGGTYSGPGVTNGMFDPAIGPGMYEIIYSFENANGCTNTAMQSISVTPASIAVTSFTLVDADSDLDLLALEEGMAYDLSNLPTTFFNIRANCTDNAASVVLSLTGGLTSQRSENVAPFALFGDTNGNYAGNQFPVGSYTVTAVPYAGSGGTGQTGESLSINFSLFQSGTGKQATESLTKGYELSIHPNSASTSVKVSLTDSSVQIKSIMVHDLSGRKVGEFMAQDFLQGSDYVLPVYQFQSGIYIITTIDSQGTINQKRLSVQN